MHLWQEKHGSDAGSLSLPAICWCVLLTCSITDDGHVNLLSETVPAKVLLRKVTVYPFAINIMWGATLKPCKYSHQTFNLLIYINVELWFPSLFNGLRHLLLPWFVVILKLPSI